MDLRPTRIRLLIYSTTEKYKAEVKGATLVPSCTLLPLAGLATRKFHPQFSKIIMFFSNIYVLSVWTWATPTYPLCYTESFLSITSNQVI